MRIVVNEIDVSNSAILRPNQPGKVCFDISHSNVIADDSTMLTLEIARREDAETLLGHFAYVVDKPALTQGEWRLVADACRAFADSHPLAASLEQIATDICDAYGWTR